jgi:hypothetical protein
MGELVQLLIWIVVGLVKLVLGILGLILRGLRGAQARLDDRRPAVAGAATPATLARAPVSGKSPTRAGRIAPAAQSALLARANELTTRAAALAALAGERPSTRRFERPILALVDRAEAEKPRIRRSERDDAALGRALEREESLLAILDEMIGERRGPFAELLGDADALADASYTPIVEYCDNRGIPLSSDRTATMVGGDKLFFLSIDDPTGLAAIVLPETFAGELMTWPAIAHEIAHDFFRSVNGLPGELRRACELGDDVRLVAPPGQATSADVSRFMASVVQRANNAWVEELFADAFGTMMLGPAYIETMSASFGSPERPALALAIMSEDGPNGPRYEEHPPGHVRVVVGCRLLARMGYGKEADRLEQAWRARHGDPEAVYVPLPNGRWVSIPETTVLDRAETVGQILYMTGLPCLRGQPLRSLTMLDFGPRESEQAKRVARSFVSQQPARTRDPRVLVAGAVLATVEAPARAAAIYALAREAIVGVGERARAAAELATEAGQLGVIDARAMREAMILQALLASRRAR